MAISRKSDGSLGLNDILIEIGAQKGDVIDFISLADALGVSTSNIVLPDSFIGKTLSLTSNSATTNPSSLSFISIGEEKSVSVSASGLYRISNLPNWIVFDKTFSNGTFTFNVRANDNSLLGSDTRTGSILVIGSNNSTIATIPVSQQGNQATIQISPSTISATTAAKVSTITLTLSNILEVINTTLSNTNGFSLRNSVSKTIGSTNTTHEYTLDISENVSAERSCIVSFEVAGGGFTNTIATNVTQAGFIETLSIATSALSFIATGETKSFVVLSNTDWISSIIGTGYQQSLSAGTGFVTTNLSSNGDNTIYIKASDNTSTGTRIGTVSVSVSDGDPLDLVSLSQVAKPAWNNSNISISGFDVNNQGTITVPSVSTTGNIGYSITYTTGNNSGTQYTNTFPLVSSNTTRYANVTVTVPSTYSNPGTFTKTVSATQELASTFTSNNISITGFDVDSIGTISTVSVSPAATSIIYSTSTNGGGTRVVPPNKFALTSVNTTRYVTATVIAPAGYFNEGTPVSKTVTAIQEERFYDTDEISIGFFNVSENGVITIPSISATGNPTITTTYTFLENGGTSTNSTKGFPVVLDDTTRWVNTTLTVPSGWFNSGNTITRSKSAVQSGAVLDGNLYYPANSTQTFNNWSPGSLGGSYTNTSFFGATETAPAYLTFSLRTNVIVEYNVQEFGNSNFRIVQPTNDFDLFDDNFNTQLDVTPYNTHFRLKVTPPAQGQSVSTTMYFTTNDTNNAGFEITITLGKLQGSGVGVNPSVNPSVRPSPPIQQ